MQTEELSSQAQPSSTGSAGEEEKFAPSADEALKEIKEATGAKNMEVGMWTEVVVESFVSFTCIAFKLLLHAVLSRR